MLIFLENRKFYGEHVLSHKLHLIPFCRIRIRVGVLVFISIAVMTTGAYLASVNDLDFNVTGYIWMSLNCLLTAGKQAYLAT